MSSSRPASIRRIKVRALACIISLAPVAASAADPSLSSAPLAPRSIADGSTLFTTLSPAQTGLSAVNLYDDPAMWKEKYREFSLGAIGTGVAIGDVDGDGKPDVFVVRKTGENRLFRNLGGFRFEDMTATAGVAGPVGPWKQGASLADVNNDGRLDLYVCRFNAPNLLYINQGDGTFVEEAAARGLAISDASSHAAFADFDRDGALDVFLQTNVLDTEARPNGQRDYLFRNNGNGTFSDVTDKAGLFGETQGHSATWWDYNEDGWPDIYVANDFKDPDQLYRNNGDGTFTNVLSWVVAHTPHSSMGADLGDLDNDGHFDLVVADMAATTRLKDHRGMAKLRAGLPESDSKPLAAPQYMRNAVFLNTGTGHTLEAAFLTGLDATDWTWAVRLEDLDNDGWVDAYFTNGMVRELHNADIVAKMVVIENISQRTLPMQSSPPLSENNLVFRNSGDLRFENVSQAWGLDHHGISFGAAFGDLDGDGDLDLVFSNYDADVVVCRNDSAAGNRLLVDLRGRASNRHGVGATVEIETEKGKHTRQLVLARGYLSTSEPTLHFGLGETNRILRLTVRWPNGRRQAFENLEVNRRFTITEPEGRVDTPPPPSPSVRAQNGQFSDVSEQRGLSLPSKESTLNELVRQPLLTIRLNRFGPSAAAADLDGDGQDDLALGGATGESGKLLFNQGDGNFLGFGNPASSGATTAGDAGFLFIDVDGDSDADMISTKGGTAKDAANPIYQPRLFLNDGSGRFTAAASEALPEVLISASAVVAADYNRDGHLDLFIGSRTTPWQYPQAQGSVLWENRGGSFVDVTESVAPLLKTAGLVTAALWSDVDDDGWSDLLLTTEWGGVRYLRNRQGRSFDDESDAGGFATAGKGWWRSISAADFNRDGKIDYAIGNLGLNTSYEASPERPALLLAGKVDGSPRTALIEVQHEGQNQYVTRSLPVISSTLPSVGRKFTTYESYAAATLQDVMPGAFLSTAERLEATEFRSGVLLSQPDGSRRFVPLPTRAQTAPIFGLVAGDFDGDGHDDLCAVQNSHAPIPEVGRFDGGLGWFLQGDGRGGFLPVPPSQSGFIVQGDAKALVRLDFDRDGWPDLFATRNNHRTIALRNNGSPGHSAAALVLQGPPSNPSAIGARLRILRADGSTQTAEVYGGSGYLSQSSSSVFVGFPSDHPPASVEVRWPDGRSTTHPWTTGSTKITLKHSP